VGVDELPDVTRVRRAKPELIRNLILLEIDDEPAETTGGVPVQTKDSLVIPP
jgi:hypothetical protein